MITGLKEKQNFIITQQKNTKGLAESLIRIKFHEDAFDSCVDYGDLYLDISNLRGVKSFYYMPYSEYILDNNWEHRAFIINDKITTILTKLDIYEEDVIFITNEEDAKMSLLNHIVKQIDTLCKMEANMVNKGFSKSVELGKAFLLNSIASFEEHLTAKSKHIFVKSLSYEYRAFIIGFLRNIDAKYLSFALEEILIHHKNISSQELLFIAYGNKFEKYNIDFK